MAKPLHRVFGTVESRPGSRRRCAARYQQRFVVKKNVFSGKAFANITVTTPIKIIALNPNAYKTVSRRKEQPKWLR